MYITGKPINQKKDRSGSETKLYIYEGSKIEVLPYFLYEVSIYKYWKNGFCLLGNKFFKTNKPLRQYNNFKYFKEYFVEKEVSLLGAPIEFIEELNLIIYKPKKKKK